MLIPEEQSASSTESSALYPKVMYRVIDGISNGWLFQRYRDYSQFDNPDTLPNALIETNHARLVDALLVQNTGAHVFANILYAHLRKKDFATVLEILRKYPENESALQHDVLIAQLFESHADDAILEDFTRYFAVREEFRLVRNMIEQVWVRKRYPLAEKIITDFLPEHQQSTLLLWHRAVQGLPISDIEVREAMTTLCEYKAPEEDVRDERRSASDITGSFIQALDTMNIDLGVVRAAIETQDSHALDGVYSFSNRNEIDAKIQKALLDARDFAGAEAFIKSTGGRSYHFDELAEAKIAHARETGNQALYWEGLETYTKVRDEKIAELQKERERIDGDRERYSREDWFVRLDLYREQAWKYANLAIYDLTFRTAADAKPHIDSMIEATQAMGIPGKPDCKRPHQRRLRRMRKRLMKELKRHFLVAGFLDALPEQGGWNALVKHPDDLTRDRAEFEERKEQRKSSATDVWYQDHERQRANAIAATTSSIAKGEMDLAVTVLLSGISYYSDGDDFESARLLLEAKPELFAQMTPKLTEKYFERDESRRLPREGWKGLGSYYAAANRCGVLGEAEWKALYDALWQARMTDEGMEDIPSEFVVTFVRELITQGDFETAWNAYEKMRKMGNGAFIGRRECITAQTHQTCLSHFIRGLKDVDAGVAGSVRSCLQDRKLSESANVSESLAFNNTEAEVQRMLKNEELTKNAESQTLALCTTPQAVREWTRLMAMGGVRTPHEKKDALLAVYSAKTTTEHMRYRIVDTLIEHKIPGAEAMAEIKKTDTPDRMTRHFFRKLVKQEILHQHTLEYLTEDSEHLPHLRRLLSEFQNEFNTVMETIANQFSHRRSLRFQAMGELTQEGVLVKALKPQDWDGVMTVLRHLGIFTPGIYAEAKAGSFDVKVLNGIEEKIRVLKKQLFSKRPFENDVSPELQAEIIYAAYRPVNTDLSSVQRLCSQLHDCSSHLDGFVIPEDGYKLDLQAQKQMKLKEGSQPPVSVNLAKDIQKSLLLTSNKDLGRIRKTTKSLCDSARLRFLGDVSLEDIIAVFGFSDIKFPLQCFLDLAVARTNNDLFKSLTNLQEALGIWCTDNLESVIASFFAEHHEKISKTVTGLATDLRLPKLKSAFEQQCQTALDSSLEDIPLTAKAIATVMLKKLKSLKQAQKHLREDLSHFETDEGEAAVAAVPKLRAVISKNIASFFGKASAGICTDRNLDLFYREDHFNINIIDEEKQVCVGNVQAYIMEHKGKKHLLLRGFNPSTSLLKEIDAGSFCDAVIAVGEQFVRKNNLSGLILSEQGDFLALSNRPEATGYLTRKYQKQGIELEPFGISNGVDIKAGYLVSTQEDTLEQTEYIAPISPESAQLQGSFA